MGMPDKRCAYAEKGGTAMTEQWQELKETIAELRNNDGTGTQQEVCKFLANLMDILEKQMQEPKMGHWIGIDEEPHEVWECDHCGFVIDGSGCIDPYDYRDTYKFCPNCGCRMVESQESEDKE